MRTLWCLILVLTAGCGLAFANGGGTCATATPITPASLPFSETGQFDGDDDCQVPAATPYNEVFYTFTPSATSPYEFRLRSYATVAPAIRILSGACCTTGTSVSVFYSGTSIPTDCPNPNGTGYEPSTVVTYARALLTAGTQYWIQVGTSTTTVTTANYDFTLENVPCPNFETVGIHNTCTTAQSMVYPDSIAGYAGPTTPDWYTFNVAGPNPDSVLIFVGGDEFGHCNSGLYPGDATHAVNGRFTLFKGCAGTTDSIGYSDEEGCASDAKKSFCLAPGAYYVKVWNYGDTTQYVMSVKSLGTCGQTPGKCLYGFPCTPSCANLTQPYCTALGGTWTANANCTGWTPPNPGDICCTAVPITTIPYTDPNGTLIGYGYDYAPSCLGNYSTGPDRVYLLTLTSPMRLRARVTNLTAGGYPGIGIFDGCPNTGNCLATATGSGPVSTPFVNLAAGSYYVLVDDYPIIGYYSFPYTLIVTDQPPDCNELYNLCGTPGETEPNDSYPSQVDPTQLGCASTIYGRACGGTDHDVFRIVVPARKSLTIQVRDGASCSTYPPLCAVSDLLDSTGAIIGTNNVSGWQIDNTAYTALTRYIDVHPAAAACTTTYKVTTTCVDLYDCATVALCGSPGETEPNDSYLQPDVLPVGCATTVYGRVCALSDHDVYQVTIPARKLMTVQFWDGSGCAVTPPTCLRASLLDQNGIAIGVDQTAPWLIANQGAGPLTRFLDLHVASACSTTYKMVSSCVDIGSSCAAATTISGIPFADTGNLDGDVDCVVSGLYPPYNDITYLFTPNVTGPYQFRLRNYTTGAGAIRIVSGQCCTSGVSVSVAYSATSVPTDCPNPTGPGNEPATVVTYARAVLTAGTQYWVKVGTAASTVSTAAYDLMIVSVPCPPSESATAHSTCATAQSLSNYSTAHVDSVTGIANGHDWYSFTISGPASDSVRIFCGYNEFGHCNSGVSATANPTFVLYRGCAGQTDSIGSGLDQGCSYDALNTFCLPAGTYYLDVYSTDATNPYVLTLASLGSCSEAAGRCCYTQGGVAMCSNLTLLPCTALGGTWASSMTCEANPCPTGRCCYGTACNPGCVVALQNYCATLSGTWTAGMTCSTPCARDTLQGNLCCNAFPISAFPFTHVWHTIGYSYSYSPTCLGSYGTGPDVVYTFTLTEVDRVKLALTNVDVGADPGIGIFDGCPNTSNCLVTASGAGNISTAYVDLQPGTYFVLIDDLPIYGHYSYNYTLTVSDTVPPQVVGVNATSNNCDSVVVTWTDVTSENGYKVFRDTLQAGMTPANVTAFTDVPPAGTYAYTVRAYNQAGNGQASTAAIGTRLTVPGAVANVAATDTSCSDIVVTWTDVPSATAYHVYRDTTQFGPVGPSVQTFTDTPPPGTYAYKVVPSNTCGNGSDSNVDPGTRLGPPPQATLSTPADSEYFCNGNSQSYCWHGLVGVTMYRVQWSDSMNFNAPDEFTTVDTCRTETLQSGGTWFWRVRGENSCGSGDWSIVRTVSLGEVPAQVNLSVPANDATFYLGDSVNYCWNTASGAIIYNAQWDPDSLFPEPIEIDTTALCTAEPLTSKIGTYYWRVRGDNECGKGRWSATRRVQMIGLATPMLVSWKDSSAVKLAWDAVTGAQTYDVKFSTQLEGPFTLLTSTDQTSLALPADSATVKFFLVVARR